MIRKGARYNSYRRSDYQSYQTRLELSGRNEYRDGLVSAKNGPSTLSKRKEDSISWAFFVWSGVLPPPLRVKAAGAQISIFL